MLVELRVENLLLIERAELRFGPGLCAITGETGAGKTMLAHSLDLLLGGRPRAGIVRPGASEAYVEGVFEAPVELLDQPELAELRERIGPAPQESGVAEIVLGRRVGAEGRTRAFVQGRSASAADLRELGTRLVAFFGQHEHRKLTLGSAQLELLDAFCGPEHMAARARLRDCHARARRLAGHLEELRARAGTRERDLDLLTFEIEEVERLAPSVTEQRELVAERERLQRVDALRAAAGVGCEAIAPDSAEGGGAAVALAEAERAAEASVGVDPELDSLTERLRAARLEIEDLAAELRRYATSLEGQPGRLDEIEERLELYGHLERKYGGSIEAVLAHADACRAERERLESTEVAIERAAAELGETQHELREGAAALGAGRRDAAPMLAASVHRELSELAMAEAAFSVELRPRPPDRSVDAPPSGDRAEEAAPAAGIGPAGAEVAELTIAPNPGVAAAPLREIASGGELSRVMLALMTVVKAGGARSLVFDEVDAGIGGQTARAVGERLRALAADRQVICITHLPQIASLAEHHFRIEKLAPAEAGGPSGGVDTAVASVERLDGRELVTELCRMLGADGSDVGARRHAEELLAAA